MAIRRTIIQSNYDSLLQPARPNRPAKLTIRLKVALLPRDPTGSRQSSHLAANLRLAHRRRLLDASNRLWPCRSWLATDWNNFTRGSTGLWSVSGTIK